MGILTDPSSSNKGIDLLIGKYKLLSWVFYLCGFLGLFIMVHPEYSAKTYFSENALLPGLVHGEILAETEAKRTYEELLEESRSYPKSVPFPYIEAKLKQAGLEVYRHNFTLHYPLSHKRPSFKGQNIYAILRAPRASSTESLVMSVPFRHSHSYEEGTTGSLALLLAMASFFRKKNYWAKDVIFLVTESEQLGMQAWLEAYHKTSCGVGGTLDHGELPARAGAIQAAINLEIRSNVVTHLNIKTEGLNGQLPNLDLVNLVNRLCLREDVRQMFQGMEERPVSSSGKSYLRSLKTFLSMMLKQSSGVPSGNHGLFHRFGIEALTIQGVVRETKSRRKSYHQAGFHSLGRIVEGVFRSLNNLLERFHQSFFFYLLPSSNRYVSIGMYMPFMGLLGGSMVMYALGLWFESSGSPEKTEKTPLVPSFVTASSDLMSYVPFILTGYLAGASLFLPEKAAYLGTKYFDTSAENSIFFAISSWITLILVIPLFLRKRVLDIVPDWKVLKSFLLIQLGTLSFSMALCNFGLAYLMTLIYAPVALFLAPRSSKLLRATQFLLSFLLNPLILLFLFCFGDTLFHMADIWDKGPSPLDVLMHSFSATKSALLYSVLDSYIYGSSTYGIASAFLLPSWTQLWLFNFMRRDAIPPKVKTE